MLKFDATTELLESLPDAARDLRLSLKGTLEQSVLSETQRFGVALASAFAARNPALALALQADLALLDAPGALEDAKAAAVMMGMNNVYYRFRHFLGKESYAKLPARLRMNRLAQLAGPKLDFELMSLAVSAINGCESCVRAHEKSLLELGAIEEHVHEAARIAALVHGLSVALELR